MSQVAFCRADHRASIPTHTTQEVKARMKKTHTLKTEMTKETFPVKVGG